MKENSFSSAAHIAFGANLEDPYRQLTSALSVIQNTFSLIKKSSLYKTVPIGGPEGQDMFLNAVILVGIQDKNMQARDLLKILNGIEKDHGRTRTIRWEAKILDLDILSFNDQVINEADLIIPHMSMMEREFVLAPLAEISPDWRHPITGKSAIEALEDVRGQGVQLAGLEW